MPQYTRSKPRPWVEPLILSYGGELSGSSRERLKARVVQVEPVAPSQDRDRDRDGDDPTGLLLLSDGHLLLPAVMTTAAWRRLQEQEDRDSLEGLVDCSVVIQDYRLRFHMSPQQNRCRFFLTVGQLAVTSTGPRGSNIPYCTTRASVRRKISQTWKEVLEEDQQGQDQNQDQQGQDQDQDQQDQDQQDLDLDQNQEQQDLDQDQQGQNQQDQNQNQQGQDQNQGQGQDQGRNQQDQNQQGQDLDLDRNQEQQDLDQDQQGQDQNQDYQDQQGQDQQGQDLDLDQNQDQQDQEQDQQDQDQGQRDQGLDRNQEHQDLDWDQQDLDQDQELDLLLGQWQRDCLRNILRDVEDRLAALPSAAAATGWDVDRRRFRAEPSLSVPVSCLLLPGAVPAEAEQPAAAGAEPGVPAGGSPLWDIFSLPGGSAHTSATPHSPLPPYQQPSGRPASRGASQVSAGTAEAWSSGEGGAKRRRRPAPAPAGDQDAGASRSPPSWLFDTQTEGGTPQLPPPRVHRWTPGVHADGRPFSYRYRVSGQNLLHLARLPLRPAWLHWAVRYLLGPRQGPHQGPQQGPGPASGHA